MLIGVDAVAAAARSGDLRVDDELHLASLTADEEDPKVTRLRSQLDQRIGEVQLPEVILAVDAQVRFSWIMLGREPRTGQELLMAYAGILAHGTSLTAAECARMIPQLSATSIRQAMRWAGDERRLAQACQAVLEFMQRHPIAATWGRTDLASSDMRSLETSRRGWQARQDPRRQTDSIGVYSPVQDRWGIFHAFTRKECRVVRSHCSLQTHFPSAAPRPQRRRSFPLPVRRNARPRPFSTLRKEYRWSAHDEAPPRWCRAPLPP